MFYQQNALNMIPWFYIAENIKKKLLQMQQIAHTNAISKPNKTIVTEKKTNTDTVYFNVEK